MTQSERSTGRINELSGSADRRAGGGGPMLEQARRTAEQLQATLSVLATIDQAIGILIGRGGGSAEEATAALREVSSSHDTDLATVARQIVEEVSRQAPDSARPPPGGPEGHPAAPRSGSSTRSAVPLIATTGVKRPSSSFGSGCLTPSLTFATARRDSHRRLLAQRPDAFGTSLGAIPWTTPNHYGPA